jgi:hypothetical protein
MKNILDLLLAFLYLCMAAGAVLVLITFFGFWLLLVLGFLAFITAWFVACQLLGQTITVRNIRTKEVIGYVKYFKVRRI